MWTAIIGGSFLGGGLAALMVWDCHKIKKKAYDELFSVLRELFKAIEEAR